MRPGNSFKRAQCHSNSSSLKKSHRVIDAEWAVVVKSLCPWLSSLPFRIGAAEAEEASGACLSGLRI